MPTASLHPNRSSMVSRRLRLPGLLAALALPGLLTAQVVINEFSAANYGAFPDNFGEYEDWIELYNAGATTVDVSGWHLSDRADDPTRFPIPGGATITPGGFLRVWCSAKDGVFGGHVHANFKLTQTRGAEGVYLTDAGGVHVDSNTIAVPNQANHSWGRFPDGSANWVVMTNPSPQLANGGPTFTGYAATPAMTPDAGLGLGPVSMSSPDPGVTIRYTLDGSVPTGASAAYASPVSLSATTVVRAVAFSPDPMVLPSFVATNTYLANPHTVYIVSIAGDEVDNLLNGSSWIEPVGSFELFSPSGVLLDEAVGDYNKHGNDSWAYPQRGVDYITRDQLGYSNAVHHPIFRNKNRDDFQRLIIKGAANDNYPFENGAHIRDAFVHALSQAADLRVDERTFEPCVLYVNGQYWGVYELREKVDDPDFTSDYYDQGEFDIDFIKTWGGTWVEYGSRSDWDALYAYIVTNDMAIPADYAYVTARYNVGSLIDYTILHSWIVCMDWLNWNTAWWRGRNPMGDKKKWRYALWDDDASFGHYINYTGIPVTGPTADPCDPLSLGGWSDPEGHMTLFNNLMASDSFRADFINRWADLTNHYLNCDYVIPFLDSLIALIDPEMPDQIARWGGTYAQWETNVNQLRTFILNRCGYIVGGMEDCFGEDAYELLFDVDPPGSGQIDINTLDPPFYPFNTTYFTGVDIELDADPDAGAGYVFDYWELNNHVVLPGSGEEEVRLQITTTDTIVAHFKLDALPIFPIQVEVQPPGAGTVTINAFEPTAYPWMGAYTSGTLVSVTANPAPGFSFHFWDLYNQFVNPSPTDAAAWFAIAEGDTLVANFRSGTGLEAPGSPVTAATLSPNVSAGPTVLNLGLERDAEVDVALYDVSGVRLATLAGPATWPAGARTLTLDPAALDLAAGLYLVGVRADGYTQTLRWVVAR